MLTPFYGFWLIRGLFTAIKSLSMAGKPKPMSLIKQLLRMHQQGCKIKAISRQLGVSRNTVRNYLNRVEDSNWSVDELLALDDPVLESRFHAGNPSYKDKRYEQLKDRLEYYTRELKKKGVTQTLLWQEYRQQNPKGYSRSQFCYHLSQHIRAMHPSMVLTHQPGEKLFIDFAGRKLSYVDPGSGEVIFCEVFVACMPFSDFGFAMAVPSQNTEQFIHALGCCLRTLGGAPQVIVPDNMKTAIIKSNRYEPGINRVLEDFANHYGITVLPARVRKPKDKALVENQVKLLYMRVYAPMRNQKFFSIAELNAAISEKMHRHNQTRMQDKPYCREERFLAEEKPLLKPLPDQGFEIKHYKTLKVAKNNHIKLSEDKHYYSVPYRYTGQKANVIYSRTLVRIYVDGKQVATHPRNRQPGGYTTDKTHLCSHHRHYLDRSPQYYLQKADYRSKILYQLFEKIFEQDRHPEQLYNICEGLLSMYRKTDAAKVDRACEIALQHQNYSYRFILNVVSNHMTGPQTDKKQKPLPEHHNIRGQEYYQQLSLKL
jgi:transposase